MPQFWGNLLRGCLGRALRRINCIHETSQKACAECDIARLCPYALLYEPLEPLDVPVDTSGYSTPPPYSLHHPLDADKNIRAGDTSEFSLCFAEGSIALLPAVIAALAKAGDDGIGSSGRRAKFKLTEVVAENGEVIWKPQQHINPSSVLVSEFMLLPGLSKEGRFTIRFLTPALIKVRGKVSLSPSMFNIAESIARKAHLLRMFYGDGEDDDLVSEYRGILQKVKEVSRDLRPAYMSRYSARQRREIPLEGVTGTLECQGDIGALEPLLRVGEYIGVGKNTTLGLGMLKLETS